MILRFGLRHTTLRHMGPVALALLIAGGMTTPGRANSQPAADAADPWTLCAAQADRAQGRQALPAYLLHAIAKVESGRWNRGEAENSAWPWTVMAEGKGRFLPSKAAAIAEVRALQARGLRNIDVGCMQINLRYHPEAFADLDHAFDPARNVDYAAQLLRRLKQDARSWTKAIALYHSAKPAFNGPYRLKVFRAWREERRLANQARHAAAGPPAGTPVTQP